MNEICIKRNVRAIAMAHKLICSKLFLRKRDPNLHFNTKAIVHLHHHPHEMTSHRKERLVVYLPFGKLQLKRQSSTIQLRTRQSEWKRLREERKKNLKKLPIVNFGLSLLFEWESRCSHPSFHFIGCKVYSTHTHTGACAHTIKLTHNAIIYAWYCVIHCAAIVGPRTRINLTTRNTFRVE